MRAFYQDVYHAVVLLSVAVAVAACATLGLPEAKTFNERIAVEISSVTAVRDTALTLLKAKKITPDDAQNVQDQANTVRAGLDITRTLGGTNPAAAELRLDAARATIKGLTLYLESRKGG